MHLTKAAACCPISDKCIQASNANLSYSKDRSKYMKP